VEGSCEHGIEPSVSIKCWHTMLGNSSVLAQLAAPQEELSSVSRYVNNIILYYKCVHVFQFPPYDCAYFLIGLRAINNLTVSIESSS
jgi:hypothetical protein